MKIFFYNKSQQNNTTSKNKKREPQANSSQLDYITKKGE